MLAAVLDPAGTRVAEADIVLRPDGTVRLDPPRKSCEDLFDYYFHHGGRAVVIDLLDTTIRGELQTEMDGSHGRWWVEFKSRNHEVSSSLDKGGSGSVSRFLCFNR